MHHLLFWMLVFGAWYFFRAGDYPTEKMGLEVTLVKVIDLALAVYVTNYVLIPFLLYRKRYVWFGLAFVVLVVSTSLVKMRILSEVTGFTWIYDLSQNLSDRIYDNVIPHFFLVIAGAAFKLMLDYGSLQKRMADIAREKAETELNFLKSQINPHFLFNSLNSVYFLIDKENVEARGALHKFSDMLRHQLYGVADEKIPLEKEISYLEDYVTLQKLRKDEKFDVSFHYESNLKGIDIEPFLLMPFVENAFKHVSHSRAGNFIRFNLQRSNGSLAFNAENSIESIPVLKKGEGGIGLKNVKRRLQLLYPGKHRLDISNDNETYRVHLTLKIQGNETEIHHHR